MGAGTKQLVRSFCIVILYTLAFFEFFQKHGVGLIAFVTENAQRNTGGPLRVHLLAPVWCLDCVISIDDTLCCDACRWQDVLDQTAFMVARKKCYHKTACRSLPEDEHLDDRNVP